MYHVIKWYHLSSFMNILHSPATIHHRSSRDKRYQNVFFEQPFYQCLGFKLPIKDDLFLLLDVFCSSIAGILSMKLLRNYTVSRRKKDVTRPSVHGREKLILLNPPGEPSLLTKITFPWRIMLSRNQIDKLECQIGRFNR